MRNRRCSFHFQRFRGPTYNTEAIGRYIALGLFQNVSSIDLWGGDGKGQHSPCRISRYGVKETTSSKIVAGFKSTYRGNDLRNFLNKLLLMRLHRVITTSSSLRSSTRGQNCKLKPYRDEIPQQRPPSRQYNPYLRHKCCVAPTWQKSLALSLPSCGRPAPGIDP